VIAKAGPKARANKTAPGKRMRRADYARSGKAADTPASKARRKAVPSESAMAEAPTAEAPMTSEAVSEGEGTGWN
jgi:hypothetical protein